ncbi:MAG: transcription factor [Candidatus Lokiarchaeota archaeon]|nr:transcription factor [Candidatus Lokiarchaeota archaeon]
MLISDQDEFQMNVIQQIVGGDIIVMDIVKELEMENELTDEEIAARLGIRLNDIRRILYKLYETRLADCRRIRDKKTGWYVFYWHLCPDKISSAIIKKKRTVLDILKKRLEFEKSHIFFHCKNPECERIIWEDAMESSFRCPKCDQQLKNVDNKILIEFLEDQIEKIEESLEF